MKFIKIKNLMRVLSTGGVMLFTFLLSYSQNPTITIYPDNVKDELSSYLIGTVRNHVANEENYADPLITEKIAKYGEINPRFGSNKKIYRLGGNFIDGFQQNPNGTWITVYPGYHQALDYDNAPNSGQYPYDDIQHYLDEADAMNADLCVEINVGTGSPQEAAAMVDLLESKGVLKKVAFFELGAEISGDWIIGHTEKALTPNAYCATIAPFITSMRANHPDIKIALMGSYNYRFDWAPPSGVTGLDVIDTYLDYQDNGNPLDFDYIAMHGYAPVWIFGDFYNGNCNGSTLLGSQMVEKLMGVNTWAKDNILTNINTKLVNDVANRHIKLVNTEFGTMVNNVNFPDIVQSMTEALFTADEILTSIDQDVQAAINFALLHTTPETHPEHTDNLMFKTNYTNQSNPVIEVTPVYKTHKLIAENMGLNKIQSNGINLPFRTISQCNEGDLSYDDVRFVSTIDPDGTIYTLVINSSETKADINFDIQTNSDINYLVDIKRISSGTYFDKFDQINESSLGSANPNNINIPKLSINIVKFTPCELGGPCVDVTLENPNKETRVVNWDKDNLPPASSFGTITVKSNVVLNISEDIILTFCEDGQLIIEEGARVNLLGGKLTSCGQWQGVEMKGIPGGSQEIVRTEGDDLIGNYPHGNLSLSVQSMFYSEPGANGDAIIENAITGINCSQPATNWWPYSGGIIIANNTSFLNNTTGVRIAAHPSPNYKAKFDHCTFENNVFLRHIDLTLNRGTTYSNCTFESTIENGDDFNMGDGYGIYAFGSGFNVDNSDFIGLFTGTYSSGVYRKPPFTVAFSNFDRCGFGVSNSGITGCSVGSNDFTLGEMPTQYNGYVLDTENLQIGVHYQGYITGLGIGDNWFRRSDLLTDVQPEGIYLNSLGDFNNYIADNYFLDLFIGNEAVGINAKYSDWSDAKKPVDRGLLYKCNHNDGGYNTGWDFITELQYHPHGSMKFTHGIKIPTPIGQEQLYASVANSFSSSNAPVGVTPDDAHDFFCGNDYGSNYYIFNDGPTLYDGLNLIQADEEGFCNITGYQEPGPKYALFKIGFDNAISNYDNAIIIGDESLMEQSMIDITYYQDLMDQAAIEGYKQAINNIDDLDIDLVRSWMVKMNSISGDMLLAQDYMGTGEHTLTLDILDNIPTKYNLSGVDLLDFQNVKSILMALMNHSIDALPSNLISNMTNWADSKEGQACYLSRDILSYLGIAYPPVVLPHTTALQNRKKQETSENQLEKTVQFTISPNPVSDYVTFSLQNKNWNGKTDILIYDMVGKQVKRLTLSKNTTSINYTIDIPNGIYICKIIAENTEQLVTKMVITD